MKGMIKNHTIFFKVFLMILLFTSLSGCDDTPPPPVILYFTSDFLSIEEGESVPLSWHVVDADSIFISPTVGNVSSTAFGSFSVSPNETTIYTLTATNYYGTTTASFTLTVIPAITEQTMTIQPGGLQGKDAYVSSSNPDTTYGSTTYLKIGKLPLFSNEVIMYLYEYYRSYLQFDLSLLPVDAVILHAYLKLYQFDDTTSEDFMIALHQVTGNWDTSTITWNNQPVYSSSPESTITVTAAATTWLTWDITALLKGWYEESIPNYGVILKDNYESLANVSGCYSSEFIAEPVLIPKLEIIYYVSSGD